MYILRVRSEHCDWSTENMRQLDLCSFNLSDPIQFCMQALQNVTFSNFLHFSQFKTPKQVKSLVKIKWLKKYTILRRFYFFKRNVYQPVEFMNILMLKQQSILRLTSTKFPEMEIFLRNVWKMCVWNSSKMWDFHAKCVKLGRSGGAQKLQSGMHTARPLRAVLLVGLKERRWRQGGP